MPVALCCSRAVSDSQTQPADDDGEVVEAKPSAGVMYACYIYVVYGDFGYKLV